MSLTSLQLEVGALERELVKIYEKFVYPVTRGELLQLIQNHAFQLIDRASMLR